MASGMRLNMGCSVCRASGDVFEEVVDMSRYIPDDHRYLDLFLSSDISGIEGLLNEAAAVGDREPVIMAADRLLTVHRYFENPERVHSYINRSLAQIIWPDKTIRDTDDSFASLAIFDEGMDTDPGYWISMGGDRGTVQGLARLHGDLKIMVPLIFDDSSGLADYPQQVRNGLYGLMYGSPSLRPEIKLVSGRTVLPSPKSMGPLRAAMDFDENFAEKVCSAVIQLSDGSAAVPPALKAVLDSISDTGDVESWTEYDTPYLEDVLRLEISLMAKDGTRLKKCASCGRYFPVTDNNDSYCNIPDAKGDSCFLRHYREQLKKTADFIYRQAYRAHFARVKAGKETEEYLAFWRERAKALRADVASGKLTPDEYKERIMREG